ELNIWGPPKRKFLAETEMEKLMECPRSNQDRSPPQKRKAPSEASPLDSELSFDATAAGIEMMGILSKIFESFSLLRNEVAHRELVDVKAALEKLCRFLFASQEGPFSKF
uniref:Uncharacterized protein n=1 Tax=Cyprinodon variegatus TaxID=28743 RepID=A0A3Q2FGB7_CYPVA